MGAAFQYQPIYSIYPGTYRPLMQEAEMELYLKGIKKKDIIHPPVNVTELKDSYKIEVAIPGVRKEEFLVQAEANIISVKVLHIGKDVLMDEKECTHEFNCTCFDRHILLPENADAAFSIAEYREGVLCLYAPKSDKPSLGAIASIAIY